jgi:ACDE family multidrug resistance protein
LESKKKLDLAALASIPIIMTLANSMLIPVLPLMEKELDISSVQSSLIITVYAAIAILCIPFAGYLSDRFGRKKIIIPSLIIAAIGGLISGLAAWLLTDTAYWIILIGRFIQGIGAAGSFPIVLPLVGDMFQNEEDVSSGLGIIETSNTFGKVLSPILGAALAMILWYLPLLIIPFVCLVSILSVWLLVKTPTTNNSEQQTLKAFLSSLKQIFAQKGRWLYGIFAIGGIGMFVLFGFLFYLSSTLEEDPYKIKGIYKGLLLALPLLAVCLSSFTAGKLIGQRKRLMKWLTFASLLVLATAMVITAYVHNSDLWIIILFTSIGGIGIGTALPCLDALITEGIDKKQRGTITSLYSSMRFIGVAAGPLITSVMMKNELALFYTFAGISAVACLISLFAIKPKSDGQTKTN